MAEGKDILRMSEEKAFHEEEKSAEDLRLQCVCHV